MKRKTKPLYPQPAPEAKKCGNCGVPETWSNGDCTYYIWCPKTDRVVYTANEGCGGHKPIIFGSTPLPTHEFMPKVKRQQ